MTLSMPSGVTSTLSSKQSQMKKKRERGEGIKGCLVVLHPPPPNSPLLFHHVFKTGQHLLVAERTEAKSGAARLKGRDDVGQVVADQTEPHIVGEFLNHYG